MTRHLKDQARRLAAHLTRAHGLTLPHHAALEAVAAAHGYSTWQAATAAENDRPAGQGRPADGAQTASAPAAGRPVTPPPPTPRPELVAQSHGHEALRRLHQTAGALNHASTWKATRFEETALTLQTFIAQTGARLDHADPNLSNLDSEYGHLELHLPNNAILTFTIERATKRTFTLKCLAQRTSRTAADQDMPEPQTLSVPHDQLLRGVLELMDAQLQVFRIMRTRRGRGAP